MYRNVVLCFYSTIKRTRKVENTKYKGKIAYCLNEENGHEQRDN